MFLHVLLGTRDEIFCVVLSKRYVSVRKIGSAQDGGCGGCCQWVLAAACETVEWPRQPLGFESLALRSVTRLYERSLDRALSRIRIEIAGGG